MADPPRNAPRVLHPWLLAIYSPVQLYAANAHEAFLGELLPLVFVTLMTAGVVTGALRLMPMGRDARGLLALVVLGTIFGYGVVAQVRAWLWTAELPLGPARLEAIGLLVLVGIGLGIYVALRRARSLSGVTRFLNVFVGAALAVALAQGVQAWATRLLQDAPTRMVETASGSAPTSTPDIVVLVLDGYGGSDVLRDFYDHDNGPFLDSLRALNFEVADPAHSNYPYTELSLATLTNMDYVLHPGGDGVKLEGSRNEAVTRATRMLRDSAVTQMLKERGYRHIAFETGFSHAEIKAADLYLEPPGTMSDLQTTFLRSTILTPVMRVTGSDLRRSVETRARRARLHFTLDWLRGMKVADSPQFVWAHLVYPHGPFVFDAQGNPIEPAESLAEERRAYHALYAAQLRYLNEEIRRTLEVMVSANPEATIVVLGDHGPRHWDALAEQGRAEAARDWMSTLIAVRRSGADGPELLYEGITHVNVFRVLFADLFGMNFPRLPDRSFVPATAGEHDFSVVHWEGGSPRFADGN